MFVLAVKPGHDGSIAAVKDNALLFSLEGEKDSSVRHTELMPTMILKAAEQTGEVPDVVALGGWARAAGYTGHQTVIGAGYHGATGFIERPCRVFGKELKLFSSSHERSHIMMPVGMAPRDDAPVRAVLVWEGNLGNFYLLDQHLSIMQRMTVLEQPGARYAFLYGLADPTFPDSQSWRGHRVEDAGKLMALAAYGDADQADADIVALVDRLLTMDIFNPAPKGEFNDTPVYNAGLQTEPTTIAAALLTRRIFEIFAEAATDRIPRDIPLHISGGCGLNCDWNAAWRELGHFSSVFVPPCTDDSGSAIGTALDALATLNGDPYISWSVYSGLEFESDVEPDSRMWKKRPLEMEALSQVLEEGHIVAWVQGRWEIGPRALGHRSILAEPFDPGIRDRLNHVKQREGFRPIAPCCRVEDASEAFTGHFEDPYMLYFRMARRKDLGAVTHVDGSARVQTVSKQTNERLYDLLSAFATRTGIGVLCNTSLNFKGFGFINRMSDLLAFCQDQGIFDIVVNDAWFERTGVEAEEEKRALVVDFA